ncbi:hypothetical protein EU546_06590 [Candidatus Thorarchaeota archaeon]|nr:MAG: hypothetical protein EU546_06590 [Candidatus Thorarchaeota archaeon]
MNKGKIVTAFFFTIWCVAAFGMGIWILETFPFGMTPGPVIMEYIPVIMPFAMGFIGFCICVAVLRSKPPDERIESVYPSRPTVYTGDYVSEYEMPEEADEGKSNYQLPSHCPSCDAAISKDDVDWVGPLQGKCTYCGAVFDARVG